MRWENNEQKENRWKYSENLSVAFVEKLQATACLHEKIEIHFMNFTHFLLPFQKILMQKIILFLQIVFSMNTWHIMWMSPTDIQYWYDQSYNADGIFSCAIVLRVFGLCGYTLHTFIVHFAIQTDIHTMYRLHRINVTFSDIYDDGIGSENFLFILYVCHDSMYFRIHAIIFHWYTKHFSSTTCSLCLSFQSVCLLLAIFFFNVGAKL